MDGTENHFRRVVYRLWRAHEKWGVAVISRIIRRGALRGNYPKEFLQYDYKFLLPKKKKHPWGTRKKRILLECTYDNHQKKLATGMGYCNLCVRKLF